MLRLLLVGVLPFIPETYQAVRAMLDQLNMREVEHTLSIDIKMQRIICGKAAGNPTHGCVYCSAARPYLTPGKLYTVGDLKRLHQQFLAAGAKTKEQRLWDNVVNEPLLQAEDSELILDLLPIPQLHILLGIVDKLLTLMEDSLFEGDRPAGREFMDQFLKSQHIVRKEYQVLFHNIMLSMFTFYVMLCYFTVFSRVSTPLKETSARLSLERVRSWRLRWVRRGYWSWRPATPS